MVMIKLTVPARPNMITPTPSPKIPAAQFVAQLSITPHNTASRSTKPAPIAPSAYAAANLTGTGSAIMPRLSLPAFAAPKVHRKLNHRQSHPPPGSNQPVEEDLYDKRFITLETLGKGAFSTVLRAQERDGDGVYAVKKARGVFDGVKDRCVLILAAKLVC
jgi:mitosis inhibitor protein kinase SWE1